MAEAPGGLGLRDYDSLMSNGRAAAELGGCLNRAVRMRRPWLACAGLSGWFVIRLRYRHLAVSGAGLEVAAFYTRSGAETLVHAATAGKQSGLRGANLYGGGHVLVWDDASQSGGDTARSARER